MVNKRLPTSCPGCGRSLNVVRLACDGCETTVEGSFGLPLVARLDMDDRIFLLRLLKASGSLKDLARSYGISYPTVRNRLDALIEKVERLEAEFGEKED